MKRRRAYLAGLVVGGVLWTTVMLELAIYHMHGGRFYWNVGMSLPPGLYRCQPVTEELESGTLALIAPGEEQEALVHSALPGAEFPRLWMKQVVGRVGQTVCLQANTVRVEETVVATRPLLADYPSLPHVEGCWTLRTEQVFVLGTHPRSFDARYTGPWARGLVQGQCQAVWTWEAK